MFGRSKAAPATPAPTRRTGFVQVVGLEATPDTINVGKIAGLQALHGDSLTGRAGTVVGYDGGDPGMSLQRVIPASPTPVALALASVYAYQPEPAGSDYPDSVSTNPALDPYNAALFARMNRA